MPASLLPSKAAGQLLLLTIFCLVTFAAGSFANQRLSDRGSLVIIRDMITGKTRFGDFLNSPERIPTNILTERLQRLESYGLIERQRYQQNPVRFAYRMTKKGADLLPALQAVCIWANRHLPETLRPPKSFLVLKPDDITRANRAGSRS